MRRRLFRVLISLAGVVMVTLLAYRVIHVNATTVGFGYLLLILVLASIWGFLEAAAASILATFTFNFYFLPPIGTLTISDPQNWVALFSFLAVSLIASRLSVTAKTRALEAIERRQDLERLYGFSRAILLIDRASPFPKQLVERLADIFGLSGVVLYERRGGEFYRAGSSGMEQVVSELREISSQSGSRVIHGDPIIMSVSLGAEPVAAIALRGANMADSVLQGVANLVAVGLERARAQDLAEQIEAARQSERLRTTLIDAMAHEFKTPLTLIKAATTSLLANPGQSPETRAEQLRAADEEAEHLRQLIDDAVEMARLDTAHIQVNPELSDLPNTVREVLMSLQTEIENHPVRLVCDPQPAPLAFDRRLLKLAVRQLVDNALKYSPPDKPVAIHVHFDPKRAIIEVTDYGAGITAEEQKRIFERFYRSPIVKDQIPGSGLGLSIALSIVRAHNGELSVSSQPGRTTFQMTLPVVSLEVA